MNAPSMTDPWQRWKQARLKAFHESMPLYVSLVICYLVLIGLAIRGVDPWVTVALSSTVIAFGSELTSTTTPSHHSRPALCGGSARRRMAVVADRTHPVHRLGAHRTRFPSGCRTSCRPRCETVLPSPAWACPRDWTKQLHVDVLRTLIVFVLIAWDLHPRSPRRPLRPSKPFHPSRRDPRPYESR